jgi:hypothetical protein
MADTRQKRHAAAFKAKVALEAVKQTPTPAELSRAYQVQEVDSVKWTFPEATGRLHLESGVKRHHESCRRSHC